MQEERGDAWPVDLVDDDGKERSWNYFLCGNLAELLSAAA
jgi:hypothetical protein